MKKKPLYPAGDSDTVGSILESGVQFCDVIIAGKDCAAALKYDDENMFAPMSVMLEKDTSAEALIRAAENSGVPVVKNIILAKNLVSYGKIGKGIPESSYQDVSLIFARLGSKRVNKRPKEFRKSRRGMPVRIPRPVSLEMGIVLDKLTCEGPGREELLTEPLNAIRRRIVRLLGFAIPRFRISLNTTLRNDEYRILFKGLEAGRGRFELGWYDAENTPIPQAYFPDLMNKPENICAAVCAVSSVLVRKVNEIIQRRAPELLGRDEVEAILDAAEEKYPVVTGEVKSLLPLGIIREILQSMVSEQVPIRHIAVILETLADWGSFGPAPSVTIVEQIRQSLKRQICLEYTDESLTLRVLTLEANLENGFTEHLSSRAGTNSFSSISEDSVNVITKAARQMEDKGFPPVILCSPMARSAVKEATRRKLPNLAVLSYLEIPPDICVETVGEICLPLS